MKMERQIGERFKSGDVDGVVSMISLRAGEEHFKVRPIAGGPELKFHPDAENEHDRCARCGKVDPRRHRWYFMRYSAPVEAAITEACADLHALAAAFMRQYDVKGTAGVEPGVLTEHGVRITATVIPFDECLDFGL